jgi:recombination protein RecA
MDFFGLSCGGLPLARFSEVFGSEGSGKSSFVYSCLRQVQLVGGIPVLIHTEEAGQKSRLVDTFGVDPENFVLSEPEHMEGVVAEMEHTLEPFIKSKAKDKPPVLIAWDSLAATRVRDHDSVDKKERPAERARILNLALRVLHTMAAKAQAHIMIVNQNREKIGVMFGSPKTQPGGNAPKYLASQRIELSGKFYGPTDDPNGLEVKFRVRKNKLGQPGRVVESRLDFSKGWTEWGTENLAKKWGLAKRLGNTAKCRESLDKINWDPSNLGVEEESEPQDGE